MRSWQLVITRCELDDWRWWLAKTTHYNTCRCVRCQSLKVNGFAPKEKKS